ncbi:MAG: hypothetical protein WB952_00115 [Terriglobales bacterium]
MTAYESEHPLHRIIGQALKVTFGSQPDTVVLLDSACGGSEHVQLFCSAPLTCASRLCKVDAAIEYRGEVKVAIEIEESNISPVQLGGKSFAVSLSRLCKGHAGVFPVCADLLFVQVIDIKNLPANSTKLDQCLKLLQMIPSSLTTPERRLRYAIHYGTVEMFQTPSEQLALLDDISEHVGRSGEPIVNHAGILSVNSNPALR